MGLSCHNRFSSFLLILFVISISIPCSQANNAGQRKRSRRKDQGVKNIHLYEVGNASYILKDNYYVRGRDRGKSAPSSSQTNIDRGIPGTFESNFDPDTFINIPYTETKTTQISDHALVKDFSNKYYSEHHFSVSGMSSSGYKNIRYTTYWKYQAVVALCTVIALSL